MGYLKEKYTKEYYTGVDNSGHKLNYGVTICLDDNGNYILREQDSKILEKVCFDGRNVLSLGCGRGEELSYAIEGGANIRNSVGVDFSPAAIKLCRKHISSKGLKMPQLFSSDALSFVSQYKKSIKGHKDKKFNIVMMFGFVEHVPRNELNKVLKALKKIIKDDALLVINTPAYKFDNDVIAKGYDERNQAGSCDTSDVVPEAKGMHCNKYSLISLQDYMNRSGYINVTESHFFINSKTAPEGFGYQSYNDRWAEIKDNDYPAQGAYSDDIVEFPYAQPQDVDWQGFDDGDLKGISLLTTESYKEVAYPSGNTDIEMMTSIKDSNPKSKIIFDVGTFVGASATVFSKMVGKCGKVICFEPNPFNRNRTFLNLSHNAGLSENIFVYEYALGRNNIKQKMLLSSQIDTGYSSTSRLIGSHPTIHNISLPLGFEEIDVVVKTLDSVVKEIKILPDIIKIDIEGAEYDFLIGATKTIKDSHPLIYIELHSQYCAVKCTEFLIIEGYSLDILHEEDDNRVMVRAKYNRNLSGSKGIPGKLSALIRRSSLSVRRNGK